MSGRKHSAERAKRDAKREARTARRRKQTRDEIVDAACEIVLRDGVAGFGLPAVAEHLGLTNPALYYYFKSKEALLFELSLREWFAMASAVERAVESTESGAEAVEAIIRALFGHFADRLDLFLLVHRKLVDIGGQELSPDQLQRIRPVNDMLYGGAEQRLLAEQKAGVFPADRNPRRFAFTAHMAVMGLLNMKAMVESSNDPLIHTDEQLIGDLCRTFRVAATQGAST